MQTLFMKHMGRVFETSLITGRHHLLKTSMLRELSVREMISLSSLENGRGLSEGVRIWACLVKDSVMLREELTLSTLKLRFILHRMTLMRLNRGRWRSFEIV
jgi:hypothetical protein